MKISVKVAAVAVAAALALSGCSSSGAVAPVDANKIKILWVQPLFTHPVHKIMQAGFISECATAGYDCTLVGNPSATNYDIPSTIALAEAAMAKTKFDAVAVYGADPGINAFITKLGNEGYPVVTWHVLPEEGSIPGLLGVAAQDVTVAGENAANAMGEKLNGTGTIAITQGSSNTSENTMTEAFTKVMASKYPNIKILETTMEGFDPVAAQAKAAGLILANPDINAAFSTTGGGPATWAGAQRTTGKNLTIIGMDYTRQNLDLVKAGEVFGLVAQPLYSEGEMMAKLGGALAKKESSSYINILPSPVITASDLDPYYQILVKAEG